MLELKAVRCEPITLETGDKLGSKWVKMGSFFIEVGDEMRGISFVCRQIENFKMGSFGNFSFNFFDGALVSDQVYASPHPDLLPRGEGEALAPFRQVIRSRRNPAGGFIRMLPFCMKFKVPAHFYPLTETSMMTGGGTVSPRRRRWRRSS